jgi:hypothetical protein
MSCIFDNDVVAGWPFVCSRGVADVLLWELPNGECLSCRAEGYDELKILQGQTGEIDSLKENGQI